MPIDELRSQTPCSPVEPRKDPELGDLKRIEHGAAGLEQTILDEVDWARKKLQELARKFGVALESQLSDNEILKQWVITNIRELTLFHSIYDFQPQNLAKNLMRVTTDKGAYLSVEMYADIIKELVERRFVEPRWKEVIAEETLAEVRLQLSQNPVRKFFQKILE